MARSPALSVPACLFSGSQILREESMRSFLFAVLFAVAFVIPLPASAHQAAGTPPAPTNLVATPASSSRILLTWSGTLTNGTYRIERSADGVSFTEIGSTRDDVKSFDNDGLLDDSLYFYRVRARKGSANSAYSNTASTRTLAGNNWRTRGGSPQQTGKNAQEDGQPPLTAAWSQDLNPPNPFFFFPTSPLVVENGRVFATNSPNSSPDYASKLFALDLASGQILWTHDFGFANLGNPSVRHGRVFVAHDQGGLPPAQLDAFDAATGALLWTTPVAAITEVLPAGDSNVYMLSASAGGGVGGGGGGIGGAGGGGTLAAYNRATGQPVFSNATLEGSAPLAAYSNGALYTFAGGKVSEHDAATGVTRWSLPVATTFPSSGNGIPVLGGGLVYVIYQRAAYAIDPVTQSIAWTQSGYTLQDFTPAYADGVLYVNSAGSILALDARTGAPVWSFTDSFAIEQPPLIANNHLYLSTGSDLFAVNLGTRQTVFRETNNWGGPLAIAQGKFLVSRRTGTVSAFTLSPGALPNQGNVPSTPQGLTAAAAGTGAVQLTWTDASANETGFRLERSSDGGTTYNVRTLLGAGAASFLDTGLVNPSSYKYRVLAFNDAGASGFSNVVTFVPPLPGNSWAMLGGNPQHSGVNAKETGKPPATFLWSWSSGVGNPYRNGIAVEDGRVFSASYEGQSSAMNALDSATGSVLWTQSFLTGFPSYGPPSVLNGRVLFSWFNSPNSKLMCAEARTGRLLWGTSLLADGYYDPTQATLANGTAYVTGGMSSMSWLSSYNADDGRLLWINPSAYAVGVQGTTPYTHWQETFRALDPATGNAAWSTPMATGSVPTLTATRGYGVTNRDLFAIDLATHAVVGTVASGNLNNFYTEPSVFGGNLYWVSDGGLQVRRESDLKLLWSFAGDGQIRSRPVIANGYVYVSSVNNTYILRIQNKSLDSTIPVGGTPTVAAGKLFIAGFDGVLSAYQLQ